MVRCRRQGHRGVVFSGTGAARAEHPGPIVGGEG